MSCKDHYTDQWQDWGGSFCPVPMNQLVEVIFDSGNSAVGLAWLFNWNSDYPILDP